MCVHSEARSLQIIVMVGIVMVVTVWSSYHCTLSFIAQCYHHCRQFHYIYFNRRVIFFNGSQLFPLIPSGLNISCAAEASLDRLHAAVCEGLKFGPLATLTQPPDLQLSSSVVTRQVAERVRGREESGNWGAARRRMQERKENREGDKVKVSVAMREPFSVFGYHPNRYG